MSATESLATGQTEPAQPGSKQFTAWHAGTALLLALGYSGYYFCRSDLSVVLPDLIHDMARHGMTPNEAEIRLGFIASVGTVAYAFGKFFSGALADTGGGKRSFLGGMAGSIFFTIIFAMSGGFPLFTLAWIGNRLFQSQGWAGLVRVSSRWFSYSTYGSVMAVVSLSFLFGDAGCRWMMSELMAHGVGWRGVFFFASGALAVLMVMCLLLLREAPEDRGLSKPEVNPRNVYADQETADDRRVQIGAILRPLLTSFPFWMVCVLAFGTTMLRETFNLWTPTYFVQFVGLHPSVAASRSALFPLCGGISVLLGGFLERQVGTERPQCSRGRRHDGLHRLPGVDGANSFEQRPMGAVDSGWAGRVHIAGSVLVSCGRYVARFRRAAGKRNGGRNHRWVWLHGRMALRRYGGADRGCMGLAQRVPEPCGGFVDYGVGCAGADEAPEGQSTVNSGQ